MFQPQKHLVVVDNGLLKAVDNTNDQRHVQSATWDIMSEVSC